MNNKTTLGSRSHFLDVDMDRAYKLLSRGMTVNQVAEELGVSRSTLYRRHHEYQEKQKNIMEGLPSLPDEYLHNIN